MDDADIALRNLTYRRLVDLGRAPTAREVADMAGRSEASVRDGRGRLHEAHALVLGPTGDLRMLNPFSAEPTAFRVEATGRVDATGRVSATGRVDAAGRSWYANCGWDAFGIGAALGVDSLIITECHDCHDPIEITVRDGRPVETSLVFHVLVPAISWWQDIGYT